MLIGIKIKLKYIKLKYIKQKQKVNKYYNK